MRDRLHVILIVGTYIYVGICGCIYVDGASVKRRFYIAWARTGNTYPAFQYFTWHARAEWKGVLCAVSAGGYYSWRVLFASMNKGFFPLAACIHQNGVSCLLDSYRNLILRACLACEV